MLFVSTSAINPETPGRRWPPVLCPPLVPLPEAPFCAAADPSVMAAAVVCPPAELASELLQAARVRTAIAARGTSPAVRASTRPRPRRRRRPSSDRSAGAAALILVMNRSFREQRGEFSFGTQGVDRREPGGAGGGIDAEDDADRDGDHDRATHGDGGDDELGVHHLGQQDRARDADAGA